MITRIFNYYLLKGAQYTVTELLNCCFIGIRIDSVERHNRAPLRTLTLSVVHVVDRVPVHFPGKVDGNETDDEPAEQYLKHCNSHVVGQPVVHKFGQKGHQAVNHTRQEFKIPRFLHAAFKKYIYIYILHSSVWF